MHILTVTDYLNNVGGAELSTQTIVEGLAAKPEISKISVLGVDLFSEPRLEYSSADVLPVSLPTWIDRFPDLASDRLVATLLSRRISQLEPTIDLVHAHHRRSIHAVEKCTLSCPSIATIRDYWPTCPISVYSIGSTKCNGCESCLDQCLEYQGWDGIDEPLRRKYLLSKRETNRNHFNADCTVFISNYLQETIKSAESVNGKSDVIYNPVEIPDLDVPTNVREQKIITASRLSKIKGIDTVIRAFESVVDSYPNATLAIYGDGPQRAELEQLAAHCGVENSVVFHGKRPASEVYESMATATATVFPSLWQEPFGRVTVESLRLGTPVIGSDVGGIGELITPTETGLLYPPGDDKMLSKQIRRLLDDEVLRSSISQTGRTFSQQFTKEQIASEYLDLYLELVE